MPQKKPHAVFQLMMYSSSGINAEYGRETPVGTNNYPTGMEYSQRESNYGSPSVLDKVSLDSVCARLTPHFNAIQSKCSSVAAFNHQLCLDFSLYPKVIRTSQGKHIRTRQTPLCLK
eukprot:TRINITY_DN3223_c0_g1_i3.p1 TRINITY_DN3223_c0_g1~~TRINITY_DN3223_c0_g1_i3.p1  ORF type:complete len:117 (-),score=8.40 TRINITY_DN3223_c0_g1_i3:380-730(-)